MFALSIGLFLSDVVALGAMLLYQISNVWFVLMPVLQLLLFVILLLWNRYADTVLQKSSVMVGFMLLHLIAFGNVWVRMVPYAAIDLFSVTAGVYFILALVFRFSVKKCTPNDLFGIRIPATMDFPEVWTRTHQKLSQILTVFLPAQFLCIFFQSYWVRVWTAVALLLIPLFLGCIYGHVIAGPYLRPTGGRTAYAGAGRAVMRL